MSAAIDDAAIETASCPIGKDRVYLKDSRVRGFCVLVTAKGAKSFYLYKKIDGRPERIRLGAFPDINVGTARDLAAKENHRIASGTNPNDERRGERRRRRTKCARVRRCVLSKPTASRIGGTWRRYSLDGFDGPALPAVYAVTLGVDDTILYVGSTDNMRARLKQHVTLQHGSCFLKHNSRYGAMAPSAFGLRVRYCKRIGENRYREARLINRLRPPLNG